MAGIVKLRLYKSITILIISMVTFAILLSAPVRTVRADDAGYALYFDGVNDVVELWETSVMLASTWKDTKTVEVWVKPEGESALCPYNNPMLCDKIVGDRPQWWGITRGIIYGQDRIWLYNVDNNLDYLGIPYTPGEWVHIAFVHGGGVMKAYKNGIEVASRPSGTTMQSDRTIVLFIGGTIASPTRYYMYEGQIDEVRFWNVARTAEEIQANILLELAGNEAGLAAYYSMSDGAGTTLTDDSVNDWYGTLHDGGWSLPPNGSPPQWVQSEAFGAIQPTATFTPGPPTDTPTITPEPPTATPTFTPGPPTDTPTFTPEPPTATPTFTQGPPTATPTPVSQGSAGYALSFDGVNDIVELWETSVMLASTWKDTKTVEVWLKPEGESPLCPNNNPMLCDKIVGDRPQWWGITRGIVNGQDRIWIINVDNNLDFLGIPYTPGEWVHIAFVHGGGVMKAYKNGIEVASRPSGTTYQPPRTIVLFIGGMIDSSTRYYIYEGQIDEVRFWNVARTAEEIQANMLLELAGDEAGLDAYYSMSDGAGTTLTDDSVNDWYGTLLDGASILPPNGSPPQWVQSEAFGAIQPMASFISEPAEATPTFIPELPTATPTFTLEPPTATPTLIPELPADTPTFTPEPPTPTLTLPPEVPMDTQTSTPEQPTPTL